MTHPHHLHATAAAWSLQAARGRLADYAADEAAHIAAEALEVPSVLRSTVYGGRHASGGHSDPTVGMLAVADRPDRRNRWAEMAERCTGKLCWLVGQLPGTIDTADPIAVILSRIPQLQPGTARTVAQHLADEDAWVRQALGVRPDRAHLDGVDCPHCGERQLVVQTAGPVDAWTVVCATGRPCTGQGCPCGMPGAVEGVAHIWWRADVIGAVGGAR
ncbi:hypothetical protein [Micromonospora tarensis]|uniref:Uncharacterized protein n=1 Tax=Micromonospora tarensis TaxID=2806100 RepID=A0ABS1YD63_9ACTN|nr:hypothetical protein [Micromonospora tarensis]MBM0275344.1 hypothetical protein [Micromonospora tarensis]